MTETDAEDASMVCLLSQIALYDNVFSYEMRAGKKTHIETRGEKLFLSIEIEEAREQDQTVTGEFYIRLRIPAGNLLDEQHINTYHRFGEPDYYNADLYWKYLKDGLNRPNESTKKVAQGIWSPDRETGEQSGWGDMVYVGIQGDVQFPRQVQIVNGEIFLPQ